MSKKGDKAIPPSRASNTIVILTETNVSTMAVENRVFNSVAAAAVYFAHVASRAWKKAKMSGDALIEAVAADTAVLFAGYNNTTGEDRGFIQLNSVRYEAKLTAVLDEAMASKIGGGEVCAWTDGYETLDVEGEK